jgi:hypothetical protein
VLDINPLFGHWRSYFAMSCTNRIYTLEGAQLVLCGMPLQHGRAF